MSRKTKPTEPAPLVGPQTKGDWMLATMQAIRQDNPPEAVREEYRAVLRAFPDIARWYGDVEALHRRSALGRFESQPMIHEAVKYQTAALRDALAGADATPIELLLVEVILAARQDYHAFAIIYEEKTRSFTLSDLEKWERALASKEARYLRAVEELARVRRLLRLPAVAVQVNTQVNVGGEATR